MNQRLQSFKTMSLALMGLPVLIGVFVVVSRADSPGGLLAMPPVWVPVAQVVVGVLLFVVVSRIGYGNNAIAPDADPETASTQGLQVFQSAMFVRFALCEVMVFGSLAAAFVVARGGFLTYLVGGVIGLALIAWFVYPSARNIRRTEQVLDRNGGRSGLSEALGVAPNKIGSTTYL